MWWKVFRTKNSLWCVIPHSTPALWRNRQGKFPKAPRSTRVMQSVLGSVSRNRKTNKPSKSGSGKPVFQCFCAEQKKNTKKVSFKNNYHFVFSLADVLYYNFFVPEDERHDSAVKRRQEALTAELKMWEGYLVTKLHSQLGGGTAAPQHSMYQMLSSKSLALLHRKVTAAWLGRASPWLTWPSSPSSPTSSITGNVQLRLGNAAQVTRLALSDNIFSRPSSPPCETRYPCIGAYYNRLKDRPSIKASWPPAWFENPEGQKLLNSVWDEGALNV